MQFLDKIHTVFTATLTKHGQQKQVLFIRRILVQMYNKFRVPDYSSTESYGEKQKLIGFIVIIS